MKYRERCDQQRKTIRQLEEQLSFRRDCMRVPCTPFGTRASNIVGYSNGSTLGSISETGTSKRMSRRRPADGGESVNCAHAMAGDLMVVLSISEGLCHIVWLLKKATSAFFHQMK